LVTVLLAACGGGGGSPGLSSGPVSTFSVVAPAAVTLQVGLLQQYAIKGGVKPYSVLSNDPAVAVGWISGDDVLYVGTVVPGKATITAVDAKGSKFDIVVTAGSSTPFFTTAASTLTISPGVAQAQTYILGGGTGPYTVTSNFPSIVGVKVDGNRMTITGLHIDDVNSATITMRDSAGAVLTTVVRVVTTKLEITQGEYKVFLGDTVRLFIKGGTPPYRVLNPLDGVADVRIVNGNEVEVVGTRLVDPVELVIIDADNQTASGAKITFMPGGDSYLRVSPETLVLPESPNTPNIVLNVYGVAAGSSLSVFTSNNSMLVPGTPVKVNANGTAYTITLSAGSTCSLSNGAVPPVSLGSRTVTITVLDTSGRVGTSTITATDTDGKAGCS
jgi:hypothetical protein